MFEVVLPTFFSLKNSSPGTGDESFKEKNAGKTTSNTYKSTPFLMLIPNMSLLLTQMPFLQLKKLCLFFLSDLNEGS